MSTKRRAPLASPRRGCNRSMASHSLRSARVSFNSAQVVSHFFLSFFLLPEISVPPGLLFISSERKGTPSHGALVCACVRMCVRECECACACVVDGGRLGLGDPLCWCLGDGHVTAGERRGMAEALGGTCVGCGTKLTFLLMQMFRPPLLCHTCQPRC